MFGWQWLTVHSNYQGHWNALFCTGAELHQPPELAGEHIYLFPDSKGYDGQMYHYIAHDPFFIRGFDSYVDAPRMRYRRILVPLAAHLLAFGRDDRVDPAYTAVILLAVFGGGYWLSMYCSMLGFSAAWGLAFVLIPATLISMDRLTVDVALLAACVAFVVFLMRGARWGMYAVLVTAPLIRETGFLLVAAYVVWLASERKFRQASLFLTAATPALGWYLFILLNTEPESFQGLSLIPLQGIAERIATPYKYQFAAWINAASTVLDYFALAGIAIAIALALHMAWRREWGGSQAAIYLFALLAMFLYSPGAWTEVYAFGRTLSPLVLFLALFGLWKRNWIYALPLCLAIPRTAIQLTPQVSGVLQHFI
ncbi:MAG TPA: hypothetical protein VMH05_04000 [Bryobacteraceae bacterium]|nr:hypothetical protein [Bryobacteraceae bacterium]